MEKVYTPKDVESKWIKFWIDNKTFESKADPSRKPFTIIIPPPNVTGSLHAGHALNNVLQDILIRYKKMQGFNVLWVPGTDHGGIATQNVVEKLLKKQGLKKQDLGREKFLEKMWEWRRETGDAILEQFKRLGCAIDWSRLAFTIDDERSLAVKKAFIALFNKGLIYRGKRMVNWCSCCVTALSDSEVEYSPQKTSLWHIKYPLEDGSGFIVVATTRPETMLGDTAIAVSPDDKRYKKMVGKNVILPLVNRKIKIIKDYAVDKNFGTGALKVTPAHSLADDQIAKRNDLEYIEVINIYGKMVNVDKKYLGMTINEARKAVSEDLEKGGFLIKVEPYTNSVGRCYRCGTPIEPLMSEQWFLNVGQMSKKAIAAVEDGRTVFHPSSWKSPYVTWLENIRDWCISRQIWWGHRIPVYYCLDGDSCPPIASMEEPKKCPHCGGTHFKQDTDVLDTWFSSALWPISLFNWGSVDKNNTDLDYYYPTSVLVTAYDILYLWVARMVQFGLEFMDEVPFKDILLTGLVRDKHGKKMSKSLGNVVNPLDVVDKYGADAMRFALMQNASPGRDLLLSDELFLSARNFANKIWNATRFIVMNSEGVEIEGKFETNTLCDKWIVQEFKQLSESIVANYDKYAIDNSARELYDFIWTKFCDWYIELSKIKILSPNAKDKKNTIEILMFVLKGCLQFIAPIMPFIAAEIWEILNKNKKVPTISETSFVDTSFIKVDKSVSEKMKAIQDITVSFRTLRSQMNIPPSAQISALFNILNDENAAAVKENISYIQTLAKVSEFKFDKGIKRPKNCALCFCGGFEIFLPLEGLIDIDKEKLRLKKEIELATLELKRTQEKLANKNFIERAPAEEIERVKTRLSEATQKIETINQNLKFLE
jgi:valyl-tRNA synthetase